MIGRIDAQSLPAQHSPAATASPSGSRFSEQLEHTASGQSSARIVPTTTTRLSGSQAARALSQAWEQRFGAPPSRSTTSVLVAQWAHETGRGSAMKNFNFGGIKGTGPSGLSAGYVTHEGFGSDSQRTVARFRAYRSAAEGAEDYLSLLDRKYPGAIAAARKGDPREFVRQLRSGGYFTGDPASYERSVSSLFMTSESQGFAALSDTGSAPSSPPRTPQPAVPPTDQASLLAWTEALAVEQQQRAMHILSKLETLEEPSPASASTAATHSGESASTKEIT